MTHAYIGLGSNLDTPRAHIARAFSELAKLPSTELLAGSELYSSHAIGPENQPDYINAVALINTELTPLKLLDALQSIEHAHNRIRIQHWGPRTLDLDILLFDNQIIMNERLQIPHPQIKQRNFVLYPLADITPNLILPCGTPLSELLANSPDIGLKRIKNEGASA